MSLSLFRTNSPPSAINKAIDSPNELMGSPLVKQAFRFLDEIAEKTTQELITLNEIPAPPFKEQARSSYVMKRFQEFGLLHVHKDKEGNVLGVFPGQIDPEGKGPFTTLAAHIDSVFPEGTDVTVHKRHGRLFGPGIGDNASGLAGLLGIARCFTTLPLHTHHSILFVGTVGEEGPGNLRGVRHLFEQNPLGKQITEFIAFDGPGIERITHQALGSRRFEITFEGPGGHSWGDFGIVNPIHALGRFIQYMTTFQAPLIPRTAYTVGILEGGTSVNTIPRMARCEVDLRSISELELDRLEEHLHSSVKKAHLEEERAAASSHTQLKLTLTSIGNRPSGETPRDSKLVKLAQEVTLLCGSTFMLDCSSTDSNYPISLKIPAITIGAGGRCGGCHTIEEWYDPIGRETSLKRGVLLLLALTGLVG